ncbi:helix-turn-helix domain-containing protein [Actinoallomurus vinaceus]|uniref:Helix-turn-helix domain-containing protein n=1 Tax=Actinoallomurus vinaceus TaxID=1080074 RepID=A0ABP8USR4_9ACTN
MSTQDRARAHAVLSVPARLDILDRLRASPHPLDAHAVAAATGLHVTTARSHLDALIEAGIVVSQRQPPQGRGRPRTLYAPSSRERDGGPYQELSDLLAAHFGDTPAQRTRRAQRAGRDWAARRLEAASEGSHSAAEARQVVAGLFTEMGFDPEPAPTGRLLLHDCPFRDTARAHPEVVCAAHQGLLAGLLARLNPAAPVPVLEPFVRPDLCAVDFGDAASEPEVG